MEMKDIISIGFTFISIAISIAALLRSMKASSAALEVQKASVDVQRASVELEIRNSIENSKNNIESLSITFAPLTIKKRNNTLTEEEAEVFKIHEKTLHSMTQSMLNHYDDACAKYLDNKIDKVRFRKTYSTEIKNLVESQHLSEYFNPTTSRYKPILMIYSEWNDLEKNGN